MEKEIKASGRLKNIYVIIPVYNNAGLLEYAVNSVLRQPYKNINVVIVDDGSTDGSLEVCDKFADNKRVKIFHQSNQGVSTARNVGIEYALSCCEDNDYIAFCDSDDFWMKDAIDEGAVNNTTCDILGFGTYCSNYNGKRLRIESRYDNELKQLEFGTIQWLVKGHFAAHLYKAELFRKYKLKFPEKVKTNEDLIFIREFVFCARSFFSNEKMLYVVRSNPSSVTHNYKVSLDNALHISMAWFEAIKFADKLDVSDALKKKWKKTCEEVIAARLLESARILAMNGYSRGEIDEVINNNEMSYCLDQITVEVLADWQRDDFVKFKKDISSFVDYYNKYGKKFRVKERISELPFVKSIYNLKKYRIVLK
ncbi:MAG: glycosyltransferase family 2 protein [Ruminococcus sp.]